MEKTNQFIIGNNNTFIEVKQKVLRENVVAINKIDQFCFIIFLNDGSEIETGQVYYNKGKYIYYDKW